MAVLRIEKNQIYDIDDLAHTISTQQRIPVVVEKTSSVPVHTAFAQFIVDPNLKDVLRNMIESAQSSDEIDFPNVTDEPLHFNQRFDGFFVNYVIYGLTDQNKKDFLAIYRKRMEAFARQCQ